MRLRDFLITACESLIVTAMTILMVSTVVAQVMESTSYRIQSDSVNFGGGLSTSTSYSMESTFGEIATGDLTGTNFNLRAGYQQMTNVFISMAGGDAVTMSPSIPGISGGEADGSTTVTVQTDNPAGYSLTIRAESSPALVKGSDSIADYAPSGDTDFTFTTGSADAHFGYSPSGVDIVDRFLDDGGACATGALDTPFACWDGLSTSDVLIAQSLGANTPLGATTTIHFRVGIGGDVVQIGGTYVATTTITALPL